MKKKVVSILLAAAVLAGTAACGNQPGSKTDGNAGGKTDEQTGGKKTEKRYAVCGVWTSGSFYLGDGDYYSVYLWNLDYIY